MWVCIVADDLGWKDVGFHVFMSDNGGNQHSGRPVREKQSGRRQPAKGGRAAEAD
jgi:hypothetical protein